MPELVLLLLQAVDGEPLLKALREKLAAAQTIRVEFEIGDGEVEGCLRIKGKDRWALEVRQKRRGFDEEGTVMFDGRRAVVAGRAAGQAPADPRAALAALREKLPELPLMLGLEAAVASKERSRPSLMPADVKEEARETVDGRELRVLTYDLKPDVEMARPQKFSVRALIDAKTLLPARRETDLGGFKMIETYREFVLDGPMADLEFVYATPARMAAARARQVARSVDLFTRFTGHPPAALAELAARPADLPADVHWPEGGFVLGPPFSEREFRLETRNGVPHVVSGETAVPTAPATGRAIGAPSDRLKAHFTARVRLQLLAAAARGWLETYGTVSENLLERPGPDLVWPEGGWLPAGALPSDPRGQPFVLMPAGAVLRIQARDLASWKLTAAMLTPEERAGLERSAEPRLSTARSEAAARALDAIGAEDFETRTKAEAALRGLGEGAIRPIEARLKAEKDVESTARLRTLLGSIPRTSPPWRQELAGLSAFVGQAGSWMSNERNASATLKTFASAQADFRANDRDGNKVQDFWTGDVAGLYALKNDGDLIKLIELSAALADAKPLEKGAAAGRHAGLEALGVPAPKAGYFFQAMTHDRSAEPVEVYAQKTNGDPDLGPVQNHSRFGYCAFPAEYGVGGSRTYIINEGNTIFWKDTQGEPALEWPTDVELKQEWRKLD